MAVLNARIKMVALNVVGQNIVVATMGVQMKFFLGIALACGTIVK